MATPSATAACPTLDTFLLFSGCTGALAVLHPSPVGFQCNARRPGLCLRTLAAVRAADFPREAERSELQREFAKGSLFLKFMFKNTPRIRPRREYAIQNPVDLNRPMRFVRLRLMRGKLAQPFCRRDPNTEACVKKYPELDGAENPRSSLRAPSNRMEVSGG